jgi:hypothetical protein
MVGAQTIDEEGVRLVHDWIRSMSPETSVPEVSLAPKNVEEALALYHKIQSGELSLEEQRKAIAACKGHANPFVVNLFTGFE